MAKIGSLILCAQQRLNLSKENFPDKIGQGPLSSHLSEPGSSQAPVILGNFFSGWCLGSVSKTSFKTTFFHLIKLNLEESTVLKHTKQNMKES